MIQAFIDTDVIIDLLAGRQPHAKEAAGLFETVTRGKVKAFASSLSFSNLYYIMRKMNPHHQVIAKLDELADLLSIISVSEKIIKKALKSPFRDFEDAIQYEAARSMKKISVLITRNIKDYRNAEMPVMTPETFLKTMDSLA